MLPSGSINNATAFYDFRKKKLYRLEKIGQKQIYFVAKQNAIFKLTGTLYTIKTCTYNLS